MRRTVELGIVVMLVAIAVHLSQPRNESTFLKLESPAGEFIGQGRSIRCTEPGYKITAVVPRPEVVELRFAGSRPDDYWHLDFMVPGQETPRPGTYKDAVRFPFNDDRPGLSCSGQGRGHNALTGSFTVLECEVENGTVLHFAADFKQAGENHGPVLEGRVRYRSTIP